MAWNERAARSSFTRRNELKDDGRRHPDAGVTDTNFLHRAGLGDTKVKVRKADLRWAKTAMRQ